MKFDSYVSTKIKTTGPNSDQIKRTEIITADEPMRQPKYYQGSIFYND